MKRSGGGLFDDIIPKFAWRHLKDHVKPQSS